MGMARDAHKERDIMHWEFNSLFCPKNILLKYDLIIKLWFQNTTIFRNYEFLNSLFWIGHFYRKGYFTMAHLYRWQAVGNFRTDDDSFSAYYQYFLNFSKRTPLKILWHYPYEVHTSCLHMPSNTYPIWLLRSILVFIISYFHVDISTTCVACVGVPAYLSGYIRPVS